MLTCQTTIPIAGTSDSSINIDMANALLNNGIQRGIVATSSSGIDEIAIHEPTSITEIRNNEILEWQFNPKDYGFVDFLYQISRYNHLKKLTCLG